LVIVLLSLPPLALPLIWFNPHYSRLVKIILAGVCLIITYVTWVMVSASYNELMSLWQEYSKMQLY